MLPDALRRHPQAKWIGLALVAAALLALPLALAFRRGPAPAARATQAAPQQGATLREALTSRGFWLINATFFVCGLHVFFLVTHLPGVIEVCGLPASVSAAALAVLGLFNIAGSLGIGWLMGWRGGHLQMKNLLSAIYAIRGLAVLIFVLSPKTTPVLLVFAAVMGLTFLSTVPPTAGLVARFFGPAHMATLFGLVMVSHQVGGFLGAWLGGKAFDLTGNFDWMWYADILLAVAAALLHLPIAERRPAAAQLA